MINVGFGPSVFFGILVTTSVLVFYSVRLVEPRLTEEGDSFFATLGFFYSWIIIVHGWRLDPILLFAQGILIGAVLYVFWENIRLRGWLLMKEEEEEEENWR